MAQTRSVDVVIVGTGQRDLEDILVKIGASPASARDLASIDFNVGDGLDVIVLDLRNGGGIPPGLADLTAAHTSVGVLIVAPAFDQQLLLDALNVGARGFVAAPLSVDNVRTALDRVRRATAERGAAQVKPPQIGKVVGFVGAKGGVGTTMLAVNVATALAKTADGDTLLVDLNGRFGNAASCVGAEPKFTVKDALANAHRLDSPFMRGLVVRTAADLDLLAAGDGSEQQDLTRLRGLLEFARREYRFTVLDLPRTEPGALDMLSEVGTVLVVVVSQEVNAIRNASRLLETLRGRYGEQRIQIVLARQDRDADISVEDVEKALKGRVRVFPSEYRRALEALNRGTPLVLENHSRLSAEFRRFVKDFSGEKSDNADDKKTTRWPKWLGGGSA